MARRLPHTVYLLPEEWQKVVEAAAADRREAGEWMRMTIVDIAISELDNHRSAEALTHPFRRRVESSTIPIAQPPAHQPTWAQKLPLDQPEWTPIEPLSQPKWHPQVPVEPAGVTVIIQGKEIPVMKGDPPSGLSVVQAVDDEDGFSFLVDVAGVRCWPASA